MQSLVFLLVGLGLVAGLVALLAPRGRAPVLGSPVGLGVALGLVGALAVVPAAVDLVPDALEPVALAAGIVVVSATLALVGVRLGTGPRG